MTDRLKGCIVAFDRDIREDDAECLLNAIRMIKGVRSVTSSKVNGSDWIIREQVRLTIQDNILKAIQPHNED